MDHHGTITQRRSVEEDLEKLRLHVAFHGVIAARQEAKRLETRIQNRADFRAQIVPRHPDEILAEREKAKSYRKQQKRKRAQDKKTAAKRKRELKARRANGPPRDQE